MLRYVCSYFVYDFETLQFVSPSHVDCFSWSVHIALSELILRFGVWADYLPDLPDLRDLRSFSLLRVQFRSCANHSLRLHSS